MFRVRSTEIPGLVFKAHRLFYDTTLGLRVIKKKKKIPESPGVCAGGRQLFRK